MKILIKFPLTYISSANFSVEKIDELVFGKERTQDTVAFEENVQFCSTKQNDDINDFDYTINDDSSINEYRVIRNKIKTCKQPNQIVKMTESSKSKKNIQKIVHFLKYVVNFVLQIMNLNS